MSGKRYTDEFKQEAVRLVVDRGYAVQEVADRLGVTTHSLYAWLKKLGPDKEANRELTDTQRENLRLKKELARVTEERDILKKAATYFAKASE